ncbi:MAG: secretin N-terminal domain-containing protein [Gemmatimonadaceae bacterium]|nr:secretin N-terminal domain-containing protein [Gemmatimonadaceae bacterium]
MLCTLLLALPAGAQVAPPRAPASTLRFANAHLEDVIVAMGQMIGITIVATDVPDKRVTLNTAAPVRTAELGAILESLLESHGLVMVRNGAVAQVVPAVQTPAGSQLGVGFDLPDPVPVGVISRLVPLQHIRAEEAVAALKPIAGPNARFEAVARSNTILITDRGTNVARYLDLLRRLDLATQGEDGLKTYVVKLRYANSDDLAGVLGQLYGATVGGPQRSSLDDQALSRSTTAFRERESETMRQRQSLQPPVRSGSASGGRDSSRGPGSLQGQTVVVSSPPSNSLVIRTAPSNIALLRETIDALDKRPVQVLMEVTVAEVILGRGTEFGVNWSAVTGGENDNRGAQFGRPQVPDEFEPVQDFVGQVTRLGKIDVRAVLRALASSSTVKVLSTPEVLAMNNREARILVGSKVPFIASTRLGNDVAIDRAVQYQDVGTQLTLIPTINDDGYVSVQLLQEVSSLSNQTVQAALNAPVITTREASTRAIVRDGQTVVIGGLIGTSTESINSGVPLLKDIPLLGNLFKRQTTSTARTELAIFITPYIVRSDAEADALFERARQRTRDPEPGDARTLSRPAAPATRPAPKKP